MISLRKALAPMLLYSRLAGVCPFGRNPPKVSKFGSFMSILISASFSIFHFLGTFKSLIKKSDPNFVAITINSFNRYQGIASMLLYISMAAIFQGRIVQGLLTMESVDKIFIEKLRNQPNNRNYRRYTLFIEFNEL